MKYASIISILVCVVFSLPVRAEEITVAVAANFTAPMNDIVAAFEQESGHTVKVSYGSSGRLFAQIKNGAPFQLFFSADQEKPAVLEAGGLVVSGSRFTYATGTLVLWSTDPAMDLAEGNVLRGQAVNRLAIANPRLAPYGAAAVEVLENLGLMDIVRDRLVQGESISQTFQFVDTGNAQAGFVALSQVIDHGVIGKGAGWIVPASLHSPIRQDAVLLKRGEGSRAARRFLDFMRGKRAGEIIAAYGYRKE